MAITAALVKELRSITSAGMSDCKKALTESNGNIEEAIDILRKKGLSSSANKAGRIATEGLVNALISEDDKVAIIVEVNSETDFVAKNEEFKKFVEEVSDQVLKTKNTDVENLLTEKWTEDASITVEEALNQKIAVIGEKLTIRRFDKFVNDGNNLLYSYIHAGGKVAVILNIETSGSSEGLKELGKNICMQIAAMNPIFKDENDVSKDYIEKEKAILLTQAASEGKPKEIVEKIVEGRIRKQLKEVCLLDQEYVKDGDLTVKSYIESVAKETSITINIKSFTRFEVGEGLEKKEENFADEVNKVIKG